MKRTLLIAISLNIIAAYTEAKPARGRHRAVSYSRWVTTPSRFTHRTSSQHISHPLTWNDVTMAFQQVMASIRDAIIDKRVYGPLGPMAHAAKENIVVGAQKIGSIGSRVVDQIRYVAGQGKELADSVAEGIKPA